MTATSQGKSEVDALERVDAWRRQREYVDQLLVEELRAGTFGIIELHLQGDGKGVTRVVVSRSVKIS